MKTVGTGERLAAGDVGKAAKLIGIETPVLLAFLEVEANGRGFDTKNRVKILPEAHIFYKYLPSELRGKAVAIGIAYAKWIPGKYNFDKYQRFTTMVSFHASAAYLSASYGLGQIMGFNHKAAGHANAQEMYETAQQGEFEQLVQLVNLMQDWKLANMLRPGLDFTDPNTWVPAVKKYNGSGYAKNNYHVKAANAYKKHAGIKSSVVNTVSDVLKKGSRSEAVRNLQLDLQLLGFKFDLGIDGRFGDETERNVKAFQARYGLIADGYAGEKTLTKIKALLAEQKVDNDPAQPVFNKKTGWFNLLFMLLQRIFK